MQYFKVVWDTQLKSQSKWYQKYFHEYFESLNLNNIFVDHNTFEKFLRCGFENFYLGFLKNFSSFFKIMTSACRSDMRDKIADR